MDYLLKLENDVQIELTTKEVDLLRKEINDCVNYVLVPIINK